MGKSTLLLRAAIMQNTRYSPGLPAALYLNLNGLDKNRSDSIKTAILLRLRFSREADNLDDAKRNLLALLNRPLQTRRGPVPTVLLLLDGLNEVGDEAQGLIREIGELAAMEGVRINAAARSPMPQLPLKPIRLLPLEPGDIAGQLHSRGLPLPREKAVLELLSTPLVFSLYLRSCGEEGLSRTSNEEELMAFYLSSLLNKELRTLDENSEERWQIDAAIRLLLPMIAGRFGWEAISEEKLLRIASKCWKYVHSGGLRRAFPEWTGRSREISGGAENSEQWYGLMVNRILWQRMGLLIHDPEGGIRIYHQNIAEHLSPKGHRLLGRIRMRHCFTGTCAAAAVMAAVLMVTTLTAPRYYDDTRVVQALEVLSASSCSSGYLLDSLIDLSEAAQTGEEWSYERFYEAACERLDMEQELTMAEENCLIRMDELCRSGELVSWSGLPLDDAGAEAILQETAELTAEYRELVDHLQSWFISERARSEYPDFPEQISQLLIADAKILSKRYHTVCLPHIQGDAPWMEMLRQNAASIPYSSNEPAESLETLRLEREQASQELTRAAAKVRLVCSENTD